MRACLVSMSGLKLAIRLRPVSLRPSPAAKSTMPSSATAPTILPRSAIRTRPMKSMTRQVAAMMSVVELPTERKVKMQVMTIGPSTGMVSLRMISTLRWASSTHDFGLKLGRIGVCSMFFWRRANCLASTMITPIFSISKGWNRMWMSGISRSRRAPASSGPMTMARTVRMSPKMKTALAMRP